MITLIGPCVSEVPVTTVTTLTTGSPLSCVPPLPVIRCPPPGPGSIGQWPVDITRTMMRPDHPGSHHEICTWSQWRTAPCEPEVRGGMPGERGREARPLFPETMAGPGLRPGHRGRSSRSRRERRAGPAAGGPAHWWTMSGQ